MALKSACYLALILLDVPGLQVPQEWMERYLVREAQDESDLIYLPDTGLK